MLSQPRGANRCRLRTLRRQSRQQFLLVLAKPFHRNGTSCLLSSQVLLAPSMDALRKPDPGMWHFLANRLNSGVPIGKGFCLLCHFLLIRCHIDSQLCFTSCLHISVPAMHLMPITLPCPRLPPLPPSAYPPSSDLRTSFYVGDDGGDAGFAAAVGLRCFRPASFFKGRPAVLTSFSAAHIFYLAGTGCADPCLALVLLVFCQHQ